MLALAATRPGRASIASWERRHLGSGVSRRVAGSAGTLSRGSPWAAHFPALPAPHTYLQTKTRAWFAFGSLTTPPGGAKGKCKGPWRLGWGKGRRVTNRPLDPLPSLLCSLDLRVPPLRLPKAPAWTPRFPASGFLQPGLILHKSCGWE
jgi:hypothetical protein